MMKGVGGYVGARRVCGRLQSCTVLPVNMTLMSGVILSLGLLAFALGSALQRDGTDVRRLHTEFGADEGRRSSEGSALSKRGAGLNDRTCTAPIGHEATLREDTHSVSAPLQVFLYPPHHLNNKL